MLLNILLGLFLLSSYEKMTHRTTRSSLTRDEQTYYQRARGGCRYEQPVSQQLM